MILCKHTIGWDHRYELLLPLRRLSALLNILPSIWLPLRDPVELVDLLLDGLGAFIFLVSCGNEAESIELEVTTSASSSQRA